MTGDTLTEPDEQTAGDVEELLEAAQRVIDEALGLT